MNIAPQVAGLRDAGPVAAGTAGARDVRAHLGFVRGGGRAVLARQHMPYPFHITRPFWLDPHLPECATLYLQSSSGGMYTGDRLALEIEAGAGAQAHVTSQAATVVHRTPGNEARLSTAIRLRDDAFLALTNDPFILFPDAHLHVATEVTLAAGARAILADGFATHDPEQRGRPFGRLRTELCVRNADGQVMVWDRGTITGAQFAGPASPLGPYRAMGNMVGLGARRGDVDAPALMRRLDALGCRIGVSDLPGECGILARCLAPTGGLLAQGMAELYAAFFEAWTGYAPPPLRK
ncbi:urease accessory protein UreD [Ancylobacter mangrovi]|uniref:urease accessory protein UreD n=1 Tax=Ancylobacter mangrovi TaxID=2972472 RepID=UPI00216332C5|nr:urease accessory protein UreD [Ancylobacter mangrovi]MCS0503651.1 urease accessory protein UreD [Ancylobacter mangrovi]